ncbi:DUF2845 domain-containing protein [Pseudomonas stutzeri]|uniref:DUF2845 domain-containing protein n=1 Tax=Stutzerimonas stutzeri TaxID=316 RepID=UPI0018D8652C|nr:DUF2845 domain-containing protein [Stutzerimonas stutzeri]MBH3354119.1 DUF2845 domain-containing protein [Stutzerimonas stutzeri]
MNLYYRLGAAALLIASASAQADTLRCGSQLVTTGDRAFEVERKCGVPQHRDLVGYSLSRNDRQEFRLEEWVYGPRNGMLSILTFEGNRLVRIETRRAN